jgi:hypothetical protein
MAEHNANRVLGTAPKNAVGIADQAESRSKSQLNESRRLNPATKHRRGVAPTPHHSHNAKPIKASQILDLPDGVTVTPTSLVCSRELSIDEWQSLGRRIWQLGSSVQFWGGDLWNDGSYRYGERKAKLMAETFAGGPEFGTLMNWGRVARAVETSRRREVLRWTHHEIVAALEPVEQDYWLDVAVKDKLKTRELENKISEANWDAHVYRVNALDSNFIADENVRNYFRRLADAAQIDPWLDMVPPWDLEVACQIEKSKSKNVRAEAAKGKSDSAATLNGNANGYAHELQVKAAHPQKENHF